MQDNQAYEAGVTKIDDISWIKADDEPANKSLLGNLFSKLTGNKVTREEGRAKTDRSSKQKI